MKTSLISGNITASTHLAVLGALALLGSCASPVMAATLSRSVEVNGSPAQVWSAIGPFCAIKDWLPPVGACSEDGKATFVELQTARSEAEHSYTYVFKSSPLPVTGYTSTIKVAPKGEGVSTVTWSGAYTPNAGKEQDAMAALNGIYDAGLTSIQAKFAKP